jgi:hypothetical protein
VQSFVIRTGHGPWSLLTKLSEALKTNSRASIKKKPAQRHSTIRDGGGGDQHSGPVRLLFSTVSYKTTTSYIMYHIIIPTLFPTSINDKSKCPVCARTQCNIYYLLFLLFHFGSMCFRYDFPNSWNKTQYHVTFLKQLIALYINHNTHCNNIFREHNKKSPKFFKPHAVPRVKQIHA